MRKAPYRVGDIVKRGRWIFPNKPPALCSNKDIGYFCQDLPGRDKLTIPDIEGEVIAVQEFASAEFWLVEVAWENGLTSHYCPIVNNK